MKKIYIFLSLLIFLTACSSNQEVINEEINHEEKPKEVVTSASIIMGGDALTHESVYLDNYIDGTYDFSYMLEDIKKIVEPYDLAYYNQETTLGGSDFPISGYPVFNTPTEAGDALIDAGFNLVSIPTNHSLDLYGTYGSEPIIKELNYFKSKNNVLTSGAYASLEDKEKIVIKTVNGISYALLSYTYGSNIPGPNQDEAYLINYINKEEIEKDVKKYRDQVDLLMVSMHWGEEGSCEINEYQKEYANFLADLGVDIVIGTHPHVLEPIEWINDTLVIYSLGNLYSNQYFNIDNLSSALVSIEVVKTVKDADVKVELKNLKADLIFTDLEDRHKVYLYRDLNENQLENKEEYFNKYANILRENNIDIEIK